jgi:hypothetical protein
MAPSSQDRSDPPLVPALVFITLGVLACLMPVHNDTWWHLRTGYETLRQHAPLIVDWFSYTAYGRFFWNHSWAAQCLFYLLFSLGGLPLLTAFCAALTVAAWALVWRQMRGPLDMRIVLFALACSASTTIWSVRPQVFSIVLLPLVAILVARDRWWLIPPTIALWANLHAGVAMGVVVVGASVVAAAIRDRDRLVPRTLSFVASVAVTLVTPFGFRGWTELVASMARSQANRIQEWQPTDLPPAHMAFWGVAAFLLWQIVSRWRRLPTRADRVLAAAALLALPFAVRTLRNVPAFMMLAAPALTRLTLGTADDRADSGAAVRSTSSRGTRRPWIVVAVCLVGVSVVWRAWSAPWPMLRWTPISPPAAAAIRGCHPPIYNTYPDGGPLIWFVPEQRVFIDSRQDQYPVALIQAASRVEATGDYRALFAQWAINCAALPPTSRTVAALRRDGWQEKFRDGSWVIMERE